MAASPIARWSPCPVTPVPGWNVTTVSGASRAIVFDHTLRTGDESAQERLRLREELRRGFHAR